MRLMKAIFLFLIVVMLAGCATSVRHPNGRELLRLPADTVAPDYSYRGPDGTRITYKAASQKPSTTIRAGGRVITDAVGIVAPMVGRPEGAALPVVQSLLQPRERER